LLLVHTHNFAPVCNVINPLYGGPTSLISVHSNKNKKRTSTVSHSTHISTVSCVLLPKFVLVAILFLSFFLLCLLFYNISFRMSVYFFDNPNQ